MSMTPCLPINRVSVHSTPLARFTSFRFFYSSYCSEFFNLFNLYFLLQLVVYYCTSCRILRINLPMAFCIFFISIFRFCELLSVHSSKAVTIFTFKFTFMWHLSVSHYLLVSIILICWWLSPCGASVIPKCTSKFTVCQFLTTSLSWQDFLF